VGKNANKQLMTNSGVSQGTSQHLRKQAGSAYDFLEPQLQSEATNPQGYTPTQLAGMNTASQQSVGGSTAGITGQANLTAARTNNAGGFQGAIGSGSRAGMRQLSENALGVQQKQADLQQQQKQQALSAIQQLYGTDSSTALGYLNNSNQALGGVKPSGLSGILSDIIKGGTQVGTAYENAN